MTIIIVARSRPNSARIPVSHFLGGAALRDSRVTIDTDCSDLAKTEEE